MRRSIPFVLALASCAGSPLSASRAPRTAPPAVAHRTTREARPDPAPFECPPVLADPAYASSAETLQRAFSANARGERLDGLLGGLGRDGRSELLERSRALRACPRRLDVGSWPEEDFVVFDPELGALPIELIHRAGDTVVSLVPADEALAHQAATRALVQWLDARPGARALSARADHADLLLLAERDATIVCLSVRRDGVEDAPRCFRADGAIARAGVLSRVVPPFADDEPEGTPHRYDTFVEVDGAIHALGDDALTPTTLRAQRGDRWSYAREATMRARADRVFHPVDPAALPIAAMQRLWPRALGPDCFDGADALCCLLGDRWRCADTRTAARLGHVEATSIAHGPEGTLTMRAQWCDGGSELSECTTIRHFLSAADHRLVHDGSIAVGWLSDEHLRDWEGETRVVVGAADAIEWTHDVHWPPCVAIGEARRSTESYGGRYPPRTTPRVRRRRASPSPTYGAPVDALPRFARFESGAPTEDLPDLRGAFRLAGDRWERVERCE